ncbi:cysteine hydrolase family protein [Phreatobacter sp. AB_2022a]|uniref:cysteine hydrolase family protein n=1 Tax=Phreatobacter sp. AB_2022a TaxID=3003134 RepID=UPI002286FDCA|nr:cysteine hydrolase [Phreatobacter sp. AB_2022a]MCZ0737319.1 cysteine hydrolase [Phreatobacter sp. AB_2022a]
MSSAYLVLDLQNDLVHNDGPNGKGPLGEQVRGRQILARTQKVISRARDAGAAVLFVRVGFSPDYRECSPTSPMFAAIRKFGILKLGTWGTEIHPDLDRREGDLLVTKHRVSPFYGTNLDLFLRAQRIQRLVMSGVSTVAVVQAATRDAHDRDFECVVVEDACAAATAEEHENSIAALARFAAITTSDDVAF